MFFIFSYIFSEIKDLLSDIVQVLVALLAMIALNLICTRVLGHNMDYFFGLQELFELIQEKFPALFLNPNF